MKLINQLPAPNQENKKGLSTGILEYNSKRPPRNNDQKLAFIMNRESRAEKEFVLLDMSLSDEALEIFDQFDGKR